MMNWMAVRPAGYVWHVWLEAIFLCPNIAEQHHDTYARGYAIEALQRIAAKHPDPDTRAKVGAVLTQQLEHFEENSEEVNASLIVGLVQLQAVDVWHD